MALRTTLMMATSKQASSQLLKMMLVLLLSVAISKLARHLDLMLMLSANPGAGPTQPILKVTSQLGDKPTGRQPTGRQHLVNWATTNWTTTFGQLGDKLLNFFFALIYCCKLLTH